MKRLAFALVPALASLALAASPAAARGPISLYIHLGQGAGGISLLDSRTTVIRKLGKPYYENANGYMQFEPDTDEPLFDVYRSSGAKTASSRVRTISVSDTRFRLADGIRIFAPGGLRKLKLKVGSKLHLVKAEDGETFYQLNGTFHGHKTFTSFGTPKATTSSRVLQIFIGLT